MSHTPAPWIVLPVIDDDDHAEIASKDLRGDGDYVATVYAKRDRNLIAGAPDLLDALRLLYRNVEEYQRINNLGGYDNHDMVMARAAIAKAEGRS